MRHAIDAGFITRTVCGKPPSGPVDAPGGVDCPDCLAVLAARARRKEERERWQAMAPQGAI
jgi:hypothetical protein